VILAFVLFHLAHYTFGVVARAPVKDLTTGHVQYKDYHDLQQMYGPALDRKSRQDVYDMTIYGFRDPIVSLTYVVAMALLAFHLSHGFQSLFQSLGVNHPRWAPLLKVSSLALAAVIFVGNSSMPLAVLFGLVGGDVE